MHCNTYFREWVSWDKELTDLEGEEIEIELLEVFAPITPSISHNFVSVHVAVAASTREKDAVV